MKKILFLLSFIFIATIGFSQDNPVKWNYTAKKIDKTTYQIILSAQLDGGWHIYSQTTPDGGPIPTTIEFKKNPLVTLNGKPKEMGKLEQHHEPLFGVDVKQFSKKVDFVQTVTVKPGIKTVLNGSVEFMTCNDRECLPPKTESFSVTIN
jgi:DsbC/DsbD-like thiol-disulfide interchange protein